MCDQNRQYTCALTIAGSDPSGGAGIQADLKTFAALGCYGMSAITALTAQNTQGVTAVQPVTAEFVGKQLDEIIADIEIAAIKIGMLHNQDVIEVVAKKVNKLSAPIVLDPVMVAKSGHQLLQPEAINYLQNKLIPLTTLITPNLPEAELLLQREIKSVADTEQAAKDLCLQALPAVLIKGGHAEDRDVSSDCLYLKEQGKCYWFEGKRIKTKNTHGTGCTLSAAIASYLALGNDLLSAVTQAKAYITQAIAAGSQYKIGHGCGPVHHFYNLNCDK